MAVASTVALCISAHALAADECGIEAVGADTIVCAKPSYAFIEYFGVDGLTLTLSNSATDIGPTGNTGVTVASSATNTNEIVINALNFDTVTADGLGLAARNDGTAGNAVVTLTNGHVVTNGNSNHALSSQVGDPTNSGAARVTMNGGALETNNSNGADVYGLYALQLGIGNAETLMTGGSITLNNGGTGLLSEIVNASSAGIARATMTGGSVTGGRALMSITYGSGSAETLLTNGVITGGGLWSQADSGSTASTLARMDGGSITDGQLLAQSVGISGNATAIMTGGTIQGEGVQAFLSGATVGDARATMSGGSNTVVGGSTGVSTSSRLGDSVVTMTGGTIFSSGDYAAGMSAENSTGGVNQVIISAGSIELQGQEAIGIRLARDVGVNSLAMSGGTVISSGINADGVQVVWYSNDATYDLDVTGGSITGGSGFGAGIRLQSPAGGTVDIGSAASLTAGASGIALVVGADPWDGIIYNGGDLVFTTAGTVTGDVLLGLGSDAVNITGGTLAGNIVGDTSDTVAFALGTGTFTYGTPYTIGGVDTVSVSSGTARINGTIDANAVNVASGARLGGNGTINALVTVANGGHIAPGNSPGTLTTGSLVLNSGSILDFELGAADVAGGPLNDLINVNGDLTLDGTLNVAISSGGTYGAGIYRLINYTGALTDNGLDLGLMPAGTANTLQTSVANQINLVNTQAAISAFNFWDGPGSPNNGQIAGGNGTWLAAPTNQNWASSDGAMNGTWQDGAMAIFASTSGTVTVDRSLGDINVSGMQFASNGYRIEGDAVTMLTGLNTLRVGDGTNAGSAFTATIASALTGDGTLGKTDLGTLVLTGANTYTGGSQISTGTLQLGDGGTSGSILGNIANEGTLAFNRTDATAFAGVISGGGTVRHLGTGTTTLTGAGSSAGTLNVVAGTLEVASAASFAAQNTTVAANTTLRSHGTFRGTAGEDSFALAGTFAGSADLLDGDDRVQIASTANFAQASFDGGTGVDTLDLTHDSAVALPAALATRFEHLTKRGSGALTLQGTVAGFSDSISLAVGSAHLANATVNTGQLIVEAGVTLTGAGSLGGALVNRGVLSPGGDPGRIQVAGNFSQSASGRLISDVRPAGTDLIDVAGTATIGGTHDIQVEYDLYLDGTTQTLLRASGGISGSYAGVQINRSALMLADHRVGASTETLSFTRQATSTVTEPGTSQERHAEWLDERIDAGQLQPETVAYVDRLLEQSSASVVNDLLGDVAEPVASMSQNGISSLSVGYARAVFDRFASVDAAKCVATSTVNEGLNCAWVRGMGQWGDADGDQFGSAYDWDTRGAQFGFDRQLASWNVGVSFAYGDTDIVDAGGATNEVRSKMGALYGRYERGRISLDAIALYAVNDIHTQRRVAVGAGTANAEADLDSDTYGVGTRVGYRLTGETRPLIRPFAELFLDQIDGASFGEHGAGARDVSVRIHDRQGLRGTAGVQLGNEYKGFGRTFRPALEVGIAHQFADDRSTLEVRPSEGGEAFRAHSVALDRTSYVAKASVMAALSSNAAVSIGYGGEVSSEYAQHEANIGVRIVW